MIVWDFPLTSVAYVSGEIYEGQSIQLHDLIWIWLDAVDLDVDWVNWIFQKMSLAAASCLYGSLSFLLIAHQLPDRIENWVKGPQL